MECIFSFLQLISFYFQTIKMECQVKKNEHFRHLILLFVINVLRLQKLLIYVLVISTSEVLKILLNIGKKL